MFKITNIALGHEQASIERTDNAFQERNAHE